MTRAQRKSEHDYGEATVTSKGQITMPSELRNALGLASGDRVRFVQLSDGTVRVEARKRRRLIDIARANAFSAGEAVLDVDRAIDDAVTEAMAERERRSRRG